MILHSFFTLRLLFLPHNQSSKASLHLTQKHLILSACFHMIQICFQVHSFVLPLVGSDAFQRLCCLSSQHAASLNRNAPCRIAVSVSRVKNTEWETTAGGAWPSLAIWTYSCLLYSPLQSLQQSHAPCSPASAYMYLTHCSSSWA